MNAIEFTLVVCIILLLLAANLTLGQILCELRNDTNT
jgi:hypothetical protein